MIKRFIFFVSLVMLFSACNPKMHIVGYGMRKFNTSMNKYNKKNPYYTEKK